METKLVSHVYGDDPKRFSSELDDAMRKGLANDLRLAHITHVGLPYPYSERTSTTKYFQSCIIIWEET